MPSILIDDDTPDDVVFDPRFHRGAVPRDPAVDPPEMFADPSGIKLVPRSEWSARIRETEERRSRLSDIRMSAAPGGGMIPSLDQNGQGFCWAYSVGMTIMMVRAVNNLPHVRLSPHAVACRIKGFRDEGGWCGLSAKFARENGYPSDKLWPQKSMSRTHDNGTTWANAALHKVTEDWVDLAKPVYDQSLTFDMLMSCLLQRVPCAVDLMWWAHSICALDPVEVEPGSFGFRFINSWTDSWGENGTGVVRGSKANPDGAVAARVVGTSPA